MIDVKDTRKKSHAEAKSKKAFFNVRALPNHHRGVIALILVFGESRIRLCIYEAFLGSL